jgi:MOSC domain-containing protein YiiM
VTATLTAVCSGSAEVRALAGRRERTAIDKRPRPGRVEVTALGLDGDTQADRQHHGGVDQALYAYAEEDATFWARELGRELPPGRLGENLRVAGLDVSGALVGERWALGPEVEVVVTAPRIPCRTFAGFWDVADLVERFLAAGRLGAYLRVVRAGTVAAGDPVVVRSRPAHMISVAEVARIRTRATGEAARLVGVDGLAERVTAWAERRAAVTAAEHPGPGGDRGTGRQLRSATRAPTRLEAPNRKRVGTSQSSPATARTRTR